jgi:hypothetical protein
VVNCNRPVTDTPEKAAAQVRDIEAGTGLTGTGLVSNAHLVRETTVQTVLDGWTFTQRTAQRTGVPALCACCMTALADAVRAQGVPVFPIGMYMRDSYLDKPV